MSSCFLRGEEPALDLRLAGERIDHVFCPKCKERWEVPAPI